MPKMKQQESQPQPALSPPPHKKAKTATTTTTATTTNNNSMEDVLVVPKRWTKKGFEILVAADAVPRPYHLEGRFGSRTHRVDDQHMGLPIVSSENILEQAKLHSKLQELLDDVEGVSIVTKPFHPSHRAKDPPPVDARMHPERESQFATSTTSTTVPTPTESSAAPLFTYAELFAGIGGFGVALEALGGACVFCSELEDHCRATYQLNFDTKNLHGDIYLVKEEDFPKENTLDFLVGGFPCQPFSALGEQPGFDCEKGRGHLFLQIVRILNHSRPKAFLLENVPGLLGMKDAFDTILQALEKAGYTVTTEVCSARGLTASNRKRLFFVGLRNDLPTTTSTSTSATPTTSFEFPFVPDLQLRARDVLDYDELAEQEGELEILRLAQDTTFKQLTSGGRWKPASLAWPNAVCYTLTSHYGNAVGRGESQLVPCHAPQPPRRFSVRECARIMGFPNSYQFAKPKPGQGDMAYRKEGYRMVGNAVCPPLIAALAGAVLEHCFPNKTTSSSHGWAQKGYDTAIALAKAATRPTPVSLPLGCLVTDPVPRKQDATKKQGTKKKKKKGD